MTNQEWADCSLHHKTLHAMRTEADSEMIAAWRPMLGHLSAADMKAASEELLRVGGVPYTKHVSTLLGIVADRVRQRALAWESRDRSFLCLACLDRGLLDVPHPGCIVNGELVEFSPGGGCHYYATVVVYCNCNKGAHKHQRLRDLIDEKKRKVAIPSTLTWYEMNVCSHWRLLMDELIAIRKSRDETLRLASYARPLANTMKRLGAAS